MKDYLPPSVLEQKKYGLHTPVLYDPSILTNTEFARDLLTPSTTKKCGIFIPDKIEAMKKGGENQNDSLLSMVFVVHLFCQRFGTSL